MSIWFAHIRSKLPVSQTWNGDWDMHGCNLDTRPHFCSRLPKSLLPNSRALRNKKIWRDSQNKKKHVQHNNARSNSTPRWKVIILASSPNEGEVKDRTTCSRYESTYIEYWFAIRVLFFLTFHFLLWWITPAIQVVAQNLAARDG